jgi:cytochrome P450
MTYFDLLLFDEKSVVRARRSLVRAGLSRRSARTERPLMQRTAQHRFCIFFSVKTLSPSSDSDLNGDFNDAAEQ